MEPAVVARPRPDLMSAAPTLPAIGDIPAHCVPMQPGANDVSAYPLVPQAPQPAAPSPGEGERPAGTTTLASELFARTAAVHRAFLSRLSVAQADYLDVVSDIGLASSAPAAQDLSLPTLSEPAEGDAALRPWLTIEGDELYVDLAKAPWIGDHRPAYGAAVLPMACVGEIMAASAQNLEPGRKVIGLRNLTVSRFTVVTDEPVRMRRVAELRPDGSVSVKLLVWRQAARAEFSRDEPVASADIILSDRYPEAPALPAPLTTPRASPDPYQAATLFHGPAFQLITALSSGAEGASAAIDPLATPAPLGVINPLLIDAMFQTMADARWSEWCPEAHIEKGNCLPLRLAAMDFYGPTPRAGAVTVELRGDGIESGPRFPVLRFWVIADGRLWASARLVLVSAPPGPLDAFSPRERRHYLAERVYDPAIHLSTFEGSETVLTDAAVASANWVPHTIEQVFNIAHDSDVTMVAALKEHAARTLQVHPADIEIDGQCARTAARPGLVVTARALREGGRVRVQTV